MNWEVIQGDCLEVMRSIPDGSIDACVTDPPYGLSFMGKHWDYQIPSVEVFREIYRTLKDGSRLLCFGGTRTMHRMWVNIEDAGFTIEDSIMWIYGSGFPKHKSKLKPAYEPICVARKGSVSALNIDDCRIAVDRTREREYDKEQGSGLTGSGSQHITFTSYHARNDLWLSQGRWPANIILDEEAGEMLDEQSGTLTSGVMKGGQQRVESKGGGGYHGSFPDTATAADTYGDSGGASRFFYCAKASRSERNAGLEGMPTRRHTESNMTSRAEREGRGERQDKTSENHHPTVKPLSLMRYLCRLITPECGTVLDPFAGSGTTGMAAIKEGFNFIGIEREPEYVEIARARIEPLSIERTHPLLAVNEQEQISGVA